MLLQLRRVTQGFIATAILTLIGGAMVLFLIPQQGFNTIGRQTVATVGGVGITPAQLTRELELTLRAQRQNGQNMSQEEAVDAGIHQQLLDNLITRTALYEYAKRLGVNASDAQVAARIREIPMVQNPVTGAFDRTAYASFLDQFHYTRPDFENEIRGDLTTGMLMNALVAGMRPPSAYGALAVVFNSETRVISVADASASVVGAVPAPTDAQLHTFYDENREGLRVPEHRALTLVYARVADFVPRVNISEDQLRQEFENRRAALTQPEKRSSTRIVAQNEQQANAIAARIAHGESPDAVAHSLGLNAVHGQDEPRVGVADAAVANAVFSMAAHAPPRVVHGQLAPFVVVQVNSITPAVNPDFAAQRDQIRQELAADQARGLLDQATNTFDEARGGGVSVAQAARQAGLTVVQIPAVDAQGSGPDGQPIAALTGDNAELLRTANQTAEGEASDFIPVNGADVVVSVDHITPPSFRPFDEVREQLARTWTAREQARRLQALVDQVKQAVHGGQSFAAAARAHHLTVTETSRPITREQAGQIPARRLAAGIFSANEGEVVDEVRADGGAVIVAIVEHINRIDPAQATPQVEQMRAQAERPMTQELGQAIQSDIVQQAHARKNDRVINQLFHGSRGANGDDQPQQ